jgi:hypothetical protein
VDGEIRLLHRLRSADIRRGQRDADDELPDRLNRVRARHRVENLTRQHLRLDVALDVDDRRLAGDGHGLFHRADLQVGIDRRGEVRRQLDRFAFDGRETREGEGQRVDAGPQIFDLVCAVGIGRRRPHLFDECGTRRLDGHARQHGAGRVFHDTCEGALRERRGRQRQQNTDGCRRQKNPFRHARPSSQSEHSAGIFRVSGRLLRQFAKSYRKSN